MSSKIKENKDDEEMKWDILSELSLFTAVMNNRPVGLHKHFKMALIVEKMASTMNKPISSDSVWKHLGSMYNLISLDEMESPIEYEEVDFSLPSEFASLQKLKEETTVEKKSKKGVKEKETPKREPPTKEPTKKETPKPAKETPQKTQKPVKHSSTPQQPASTETPKSVKNKLVIVPKKKDSTKKAETPKEKKEPRELKNLGTPDVKQQSRSKETRSGVKPTKEESPIPTRRSLSTTMAGTKRPTRGSVASSSDSKATSPAVSTTSSRSSTPVPTPKRRRI
ncbi:uncharacterized protein LOC132194119 [Neocloeon triangulifer]|uniref:uncharacterized protein LOC132194119 n=1 Tax=Neocloeon triangulifer TaxID=2078957 RepID=UPI00286EF429|nr:uncharacterized protein LOC132194119 [Neocloeon triangulifer]